MDSASDIFGHAFQLRMKERLLRDPVHGLIPIDENSDHGRLLIRLIDSAEVQRLRRIRQLGLAHMAFQGAEHSRFAHCVGAFHLLNRIVDQLRRMYAIDSELAFYASVAALLHDLGHGPFSHLFERMLGIRHEQWTVRILHDPDTEVNQILSSYSRSLPSVIESVLIGMAKPGYLSSLVNSELDADRLDYLMRDSLMTGVKYGIYDLDRLVHMFRISPEGDRIVIAQGGLVPVEKYLQARYHMHRQVYRHKTVIAAEAMMEALLRRYSKLVIGKDISVDSNDIVARALARPDDLTVGDFLQLDDIEILAKLKQWSRGGDPILTDLSRRLLGRNLFKTIDLDPSPDSLDSQMEEAREIVRKAGLDPEYYLLLIETTDTPYRPYDPTPEADSRRIWIENGGGKIVDVAAVSPTIKAFMQSASRSRRVIFPDDYNGHAIRAAMESIFAAS